jgi:hypothetical protein
MAQRPAGQSPRADRLHQIPAGNAALRPPPDLLTSPSPSGGDAAGDEAFDWRKGLPQVTSRDGRFAFRVCGRALFDLSATTGSRFASRNITGTGACSVRLGVEGRAGEKIAYQVEVDFADSPYRFGREEPAEVAAEMGPSVTPSRSRKPLKPISSSSRSERLLSRTSARCCRTSRARSSSM